MITEYILICHRVFFWVSLVLQRRSCLTQSHHFYSLRLSQIYMWLPWEWSNSLSTGSLQPLCFMLYRNVSNIFFNGHVDIVTLNITTLLFPTIVWGADHVKQDFDPNNFMVKGHGLRRHHMYEYIVFKSPFSNGI